MTSISIFSGPTKEAGPPVDDSTMNLSTVPVLNCRGNFISGGATGLVELLESGDVVKSPWANCESSAECLLEMTIEATIYHRLGAHPRLVEVRDWDPATSSLTLEYMPNGNLNEYIKKHNRDISLTRRKQWVKEAAEGLDLLHSNGIIQSDVGPHNLLLDRHLGLRICDFAGSSVDGSQALVAPEVRYRLPDLSILGTVKEDIFALGTTIFYIATGSEPYPDILDDDDVKKLYQEGVFPNLDGVPFAEIIAGCWKGEIESAKDILRLITDDASG